MARKSIMDGKGSSLKRVNQTEQKIFNLLKDKKGKSISVVQISNALAIPVSTVRYKLNKMVGNEWTQGKYIYKIEYIDKKYRMIVRNINASPNNANEYVKSEEELRDYTVNELASSKAFKDTSANCISDSVVFYAVSRRMRTSVISMVKSMYNSDTIYDVVACDKGIYIILQEESPYADNVRQSLIRLYAEVIKTAKKNKTSAGEVIKIDKSNKNKIKDENQKKKQSQKSKKGS